ncbi:hypothetical protein G5I_02804 [Acromyrmex echinatior]|uniref:Uncharacterized protein n=1 Tax=Acromyrmex echinatior TaxID=103372 RepID=F4WB98_ACREC|nr:hypothetical protein G5I_02804 [Acromyrmex echinatior]
MAMKGKNESKRRLPTMMANEADEEKVKDTRRERDKGRSALSSNKVELWLLRFAVTFSYVLHCILRTKVQTTSTCGGFRAFLAQPRLCGTPPVVFPDSNLRLKGNLTTLLGGLKNVDAKADD